MIEENRKAGRLAVPFGDQGAKLGVVAKPITRNVRLRRSDQPVLLSNSASSQIICRKQVRYRLWHH
jgi:hypothetical protein